jgi:YbbR domain-containing protein
MNRREIVSHNLGLKALSLLLATLLWLFVAVEQESEIAVAVPVTFKNLGDGLTVSNQPPTNLDVRVAGPKILLLKIQAERPVAVLDLKGIREGTTSFPGLEKTLHLRTGLRVTRITPASVEVRLARTGSPG